MEQDIWEIDLQVCNPQIFTFDVTGSAALYSQMAGVLAAFAFGAISLVLPGMHRRSANGLNVNSRTRQSDSLVLLALVSAFFGLIIATLEYAVLAGERGCALAMGRAASEEFLGGVAFAFAVLLLLYAIVQLIANSEIDGLSQHSRFIVVTLGAPLAVLFLTSGALDVASTPWRPGAVAGEYFPNITPSRNLISDISLPVTGCLTLACFAVWLAGRRRRATVVDDDRGHSGADWMRIAFPYVSLALAMAAVVRSVSLDSLDPGARIDDWEVWAWLIGCTAILLLQSTLLSFDRGSEARGGRVETQTEGEVVAASLQSPSDSRDSNRRSTAGRDRWTSMDRKMVADVVLAKNLFSGPQLGWILILATSLVALMFRKSNSTVRPGVTVSRKSTSAQASTPIAVLEPLNREVLIKRSLEAFPAGYLNNISIIQGVALGILIQQTFITLGPVQNFWQRLGHVGEAIFLFCGILVVSYQYLWFLIIMRWTPDFRDTAIPIVLGVAEIVPMYLMPNPLTWLVGVACFAFVGAVAFSYTIFRLDPRLFPGFNEAHCKVGKLLRQLVVMCVIVSATTVAVRFTVDSTEWVLALYPWCMLAVIPVLVLMSEGTLDAIYEHYGLQRRTRRS